MSTLKNKPLGVFDIDGTFFRESLFVALTKALCKQGIFPQNAFADNQQLSKLEELYKDGGRSIYRKYLDAVVKFYFKNIIDVEQYRVQNLADEVMRKIHKRVHVFTRELFNVTKDSYYNITLTGSQQEVVTAFQNYWPFQFILPTVLEVQYGRYTGKVVAEPVLDKKAALYNFLGTKKFGLKKSFGIGDTESDAEFLSEVAVPICFNPNQALWKIAKKNGWFRVTEKKDLILVFHGDLIIDLNSGDIPQLHQFIREQILKV